MSLSGRRYLRHRQHRQPGLDQHRGVRGSTHRGPCATVSDNPWTRPNLHPSPASPEWVTTLFFIIMGIISLTVTCGLLVASHWRREATKYARWIAFTGMILFCMAALIFPIGFYINEVGGQPYKLPNNTVVGSSYVLFVLSIFFTIVGLLFAGKVCLPGWWMSKLLDFFFFKRVGGQRQGIWVILS